jgi:hypothetical protein
MQVGIEQDGLNNLREFIQLGGTLIAFNQSASSPSPAVVIGTKVRRWKLRATFLRFRIKKNRRKQKARRGGAGLLFFLP